MGDSKKQVDRTRICNIVNAMFAWPYSMIGQEPWYGHIKLRRLKCRTDEWCITSVPTPETCFVR